MRRLFPLLILLLPALARAGETDNFYAWRYPPRDSTAQLNGLLNEQMERGLKRLNSLPDHEQKSCADAVRKMFFPLRMLEHLTQKGATRGWTLHESPANNTERLGRYEEHALYRDAPSWNTFLQEAPRSTLLVADTWFGLDKISHFISEGLNFYREFDVIRRAGASEEVAFDAAMYVGLRQEERFFGRLMTGIYSFADLEADAAGLRFVRDLCDGRDGEPPLLFNDGSAWRLRARVDISRYVTPCWDESWQLNSLSADDWAWLKPTVMEYCALRDARSDIQARHARYRRRGCSKEVTESLQRFEALRRSPPRAGTMLDEVCATGELPPPRLPARDLQLGRPDVAILVLAPWLDHFRQKINETAAQLPIGGKEPDPEAHRFGVGFGPGVSFHTDEGLGGALTLSLDHRHGEGQDEWRDSLGVFVRATTALVQRYELRFKSDNLAHLPVSLDLRGGLYSTVVDNFCGFGARVDCSRSEAEAQADALLLSGEERDDFVRRYYLNRFTRRYANLNAWWRFRRKPWSLELLTGLRFSHFAPGDYFTTTPYPGSLYAQAFPGGEPGLSVVPEIGLVLDDRDLEVAPTRGWWIEAKARAASAAWGSDWTYTGLYAGVANYQRLGSRPRVVWANRLVTDLLFGDVSAMEQARLTDPREMPAFGGRYIGRGVREHRYIGKVKVIGQSELRADLFRLLLLRRPVDVGGALFVDGAYIAEDWDRLGLGFLASGGVGMRILVNDSFVARLDVAASPFEQRAFSISAAGGVPF